MKHELPQLGFAPDALTPFLSAETFEYHHGKHHNAYVTNLNGLIEGTEFAELGLVDIVKRAKGGLFNNAAQHFNHSFYWRSIAPGGRRGPESTLLRAIEKDFGSPAELRAAFTKAAATHFGSGWAWLVADGAGKLQVRTTSDAGCPVTQGETPLLTCDVWEHAYYVDYRNARPKYVEGFWSAANWDFAAQCLAEPSEIETAILGLSMTDG